MALGSVVIQLANFLIRVQTMLLMSTWYDLDHALKEIFYVNIVDKKQINSGLVCSVLLSIITFVITVLKICNGLTHCVSWVHNILTTMMTNIDAVKSTDHTKPLSIWYILYVDAQDKCSGHAQLLASCNGFQSNTSTIFLLLIPTLRKLLEIMCILYLWILD